VYLRHSTVRKNGKIHTYWRLVRSVRHGAKVKQQTVAWLGELDAAGRVQARELAHQIVGRYGQPDLGEEAGPAVVQVDLKKVRVENGRQFGDVWLGWMLWQSLGLKEQLEALIPEGREEISWALMAGILVVARLCDPSSELHIAEDWYRRTAMDDVVGVASEKVNDDRLYRALDRLLEHKERLEVHLKEKLGTLFQLKYDLMLYDVTSTYFEGEANGNPMAKRGHSRDGRTDCKQVCIALVVSRDGMPVGYELFPGNKTDVTTVKGIVETMERRYGQADRIWVMDRGMVSHANLEFLQQRGSRYLVGTPKSDLKKFQKQIVEKADWKTIRDGLEVKRCDGPTGAETFILCRSDARQTKERAMHERFAARIEEALKSLAGRLERSTKPIEAGPVERQIGRLLGKNSRAAAGFTIRLERANARPSGLLLKWSRDEVWTTWAEMSEGCYLLRSNVRDWTPEELWRTYVQLTQAEAAFRIHKTDLSVRPIWHQKEDRVKAHILVCFLAYVLWKVLEQWQARAGLGNSPRTILEELGRIQCADVVLPTTSRREIRLRCVIRPDRAQSLLLQRLGLILPERLKPLFDTPKM